MEPQTETVWRQADTYAVPRIAFVNKMDRLGADFYSVLDQMVKKLGANPCPLFIPVGSESSFSGVVDLLKMRYLTFTGEQGSEIIESDIPAEVSGQAGQWREKLIDQVSSFSDEIMELYFEGAEIPESLIKKTIRKATMDRALMPVFVGSSLKNIGVQTLLDGIVDYLPSPVEMPAIGAVNAMRSNYRYSMLPGVPATFGTCSMKIDGRRAEPPEAARGTIARTVLYMADAYRGTYRLSRQDRQLMEAWDRQYPVDKWECTRARRIEAIQGNPNERVKEACRKAGL